MMGIRISDAEVMAVLEDAQARIEREDNWIQDFMAEDEFGTAVVPTSDSAIAWCALGSVECSARTKELRVHAENELERTAYDIFNKSLVDVNDTLEHDDVMQVFDTTIERLTPDDTMADVPW